MILTEKVGRELYVYRNGVLIMKRWYKDDGEKRQPTKIFNEWGWHTVEVQP